MAEKDNAFFNTMLLGHRTKVVEKEIAAFVAMGSSKKELDIILLSEIADLNTKKSSEISWDDLRQGNAKTRYYSLLSKWESHKDFDKVIALGVSETANLILRHMKPPESSVSELLPDFKRQSSNTDDTLGPTPPPALNDGCSRACRTNPSGFPDSNPRPQPQPRDFPDSNDSEYSSSEDITTENGNEDTEVETEVTGKKKVPEKGKELLNLHLHHILNAKILQWE